MIKRKFKRERWKPGYGRDGERCRLNKYKNINPRLYPKLY